LNKSNYSNKTESKKYQPVYGIYYSEQCMYSISAGIYTGLCELF